MSTINQLTSVLEVAIPGIRFEKTSEKKGRSVLDDVDSKQVVVSETFDVFISNNPKRVGTAGWVRVRPDRWRNVTYPEFFVDGPRVPQKKNTRYRTDRRRESKHAANLLNFAKEGFRVDNPEEVFEGLSYADKTYQDARRKAGDANLKLTNMLRHLDEELFAQLMNLVRVQGNVGEDLKELLLSYDEAIGQLDDNEDIMNRRVETLREQAGVA